MDLAVEMVRNGDLGAPVPDYVDENVSGNVVRIVQSYVGVVNKMVWRKGWGTRCCLVRYPLRQQQVERPSDPFGADGAQSDVWSPSFDPSSSIRAQQDVPVPSFDRLSSACAR